MCGNSDGREVNVTSATYYLQLLKVTKRVKLIGDVNYADYSKSATMFY